MLIVVLIESANAGTSAALPLLTAFLGRYGIPDSAWIGRRSSWASHRATALRAGVG